MNAALGDAAWMTGMERNSDLVVMASYAPLFVNVNPGGMEWKSD
jgi:alpha-N-arabinofuranosidase